MKSEENTRAGSLRSVEFPDERTNEFWRKIYLGVVASTFVVVTALWAFSRYFR